MDKWNIRELAAKLLKGTATKEEEEQLHLWYDSQFRDSEDPYQVHSRTSGKELNHRILTRLQTHMETTPPRTRSYKIRLARTAAVISILALSAIGLYFLTRSSAPDWITISVPLGESKEISLPDQSIVWVNAGSTIRYPSGFEGDVRRFELLAGQAFFDVTNDPDRPFQVVAGEINVKVLGTTFDVKSYADEGSARVEVQTGQVEVRLSNRGRSEKLLPGKMAIIQKEEGTMEVLDKESDYIGAWMEGRIAFYNEPMGSVFKALERNYNVKITIDDQRLLNAPLTIKLDKQPLGDILEVLKYIFDFEYRLIEDKNTVKITKK